MEKPSAEELAELLSWVEFLEPLSEEEQGWLTGRLTCTPLEANETFVVGPEEHAERMVLVLRGQLQVYESDPSGRELTLAVLEGGASVGLRGWCLVLPGSYACGSWNRRCSVTWSRGTSKDWPAATRR